jgi:hypothetical protein
LIDGDGDGIDAPEGHAPMGVGELPVPPDLVARGVGVGLLLPEGVGL